MTAIGVGAATLTLLVAILASLGALSRNLVGELGANAIVALPDTSAETGSASPLRFRHADRIRANFPRLRVSTVARSRARTLGSTETLPVIATDPWLAPVRGWRMVEGRFLDDRDLAERQRHAVISERLAGDWKWRIGHVVLLGDLPFVVVGVVRTQGSALAGQFGDPDLALGERLVFVPRTVPPLWIRSESPEQPVHAIFLQTPPEVSPEGLVGPVRRLLAAPGDSPGRLSWVTPERLIRRIERLAAVLGGSAAAVSLLCLVLGGTTLMSLMITNVRERATEIGLRKTLGATRTDVAGLFLAEALLLGLAGGVAGVLFAQGLLALARPVTPIPLVTGWSTWTVPPTVCVLFGLLFTWGPVIRAARLAPAEALRAD